MTRNPDHVGTKDPSGQAYLRGFACIGLHQPKDGHNIGCVLRAAGCYRAAFIAVAGKRYSSISISTDTQKTWRHVPLLEVDDLKTIIPKSCVPVAIEIVDGARPLMTFTHPERAFYIFGGEDRTLDKSVLDWCEHVVSIPTKFCMNLAATVNVVLYDRLAKRGLSPELGSSPGHVEKTEKCGRA